MTNTGIFPMNNTITVPLILICAIYILFVLEIPNLTQPTQNILIFKKQSSLVLFSDHKQRCQVGVKLS